MKELSAWWRSLPLPWRRWRVVAQVQAVDEVPDRLAYGTVVLVGVAEKLAWAIFDCPCRTGHRLMLNLDYVRRPIWTIESRKPLSIYPSIDDSTDERRCHFFVRHGRVRWATSMNGGWPI